MQVETSNKSGGKTPTEKRASKHNVGSDEHSHNEKKKPAAY
jgi:hypothetical protein